MNLIYLIAGTYRAAGMERVLANKANAWVKDGYEVLIVTTDQRGQAPAFEMDSRIRMVDLGINYEDNNGGSFINKLIHYPAKQIKHKKALSNLLKREKADIVVSMFCNDASFVPSLAKKNGAKSVLEIHFSRYKRLQYGRTGIWAIADNLRSKNDLRTVKRFDKFVVLTEEDKGYWGNLHNITVIPNARTFTVDTPATLDSKTVIAVGRYNFQKQFESLIDAWKLLAKEFSDWTLRLAGDGEERTFLERRIADYGLQDKIILGPEKDMRSAYLGASILAMSSRFEGLPMVLLEAQACGLPIVSYACKCGPKDVVTDGVDGFLVEEGNVTDLADRLFTLMNDVDLRKKMGESAYKASTRFDEKVIMSKWKALFEELL